MQLWLEVYIVCHGPENLKAISLRINTFTNILSKALVDLGLVQINDFDAITFAVDETTKEKIKIESLKRKLNLNFFAKHSFSISLSETTTFG